MTVRAVAAIPAAPMLLPVVSPTPPAGVAAELRALRDDVAATLRGLPPVDTLVLLAAGDDATLPDGGCADLAGYGHPRARADVPVDRELLAAIATRTGTPRVRRDVVGGDLGVLTLLVAETLPQATITLATVSPSATRDALGGFAAGLVGAVDGTGREVAVLAAGDLSASRDESAPGHLVDGAVAWDEAAVAAVAAGDRAALEALGPDDAARVGARGWAPLVVLLHVARTAGLRVGDVRLRAPRGVGQLVASSG